MMFKLKPGHQESVQGKNIFPSKLSHQYFLIFLKILPWFHHLTCREALGFDEKGNYFCNKAVLLMDPTLRNLVLNLFSKLCTLKKGTFENILLSSNNLNYSLRINNEFQVTCYPNRDEQLKTILF